MRTGNKQKEGYKYSINKRKLKVGQDLEKDYTDYGMSLDKQRRAGLLLHPYSLSRTVGSGDLGEGSTDLLDWMHKSGFTVWQTLPLVPPEQETWSPYSSTDANCCNTLLISLAGLVEDGLLKDSELPEPLPLTGKAEFAQV